VQKAKSYQYTENLEMQPMLAEGQGSANDTAAGHHEKERRDHMDQSSVFVCCLCVLLLFWPSCIG